jgi:hypothetical protein
LVYNGTTAGLERGERVRERVAFTVMVAILIFLFAFTFAVLGKGEYEPSVPPGGPHEEGSVPGAKSTSLWA